MHTVLKSSLDTIREIRNTSAIKTKRNFSDFFADRIYQAAIEPTMIGMIERLIKSVDASIGFIGSDVISAFMQSSNTTESQDVLAWIRKYPRMAAMIVALKKGDYEAAIEEIQIQPTTNDNSVVTRVPSYDIPIQATLLSPLSHGGDLKLGNTTLFRRRQVVTETGRILELPFYSGNAIRGQMRDLLANHMLESLGLLPRQDNQPVLNLWFFHALFAGGLLEERTKIMEGINKELGNNGSVRTEGMRRFRDMLPALSVLGTALGNRVLSGRICVGDLRPNCMEWGNGEVPLHQLFDWEFITRREDFEDRSEDDEHTGMIVNTEVLKTGTILTGGIDVFQHTGEIGLSCLGKGLELWKNRGMIGAENRRGMGSVDIAIENMPSVEAYDTWLREKKVEILDYLNTIGALCTQ
jgi:hypothetical protein